MLPQRNLYMPRLLTPTLKTIQPMGGGEYLHICTILRTILQNNVANVCEFRSYKTDDVKQFFSDMVRLIIAILFCMCHYFPDEIKLTTVSSCV